MANTEHGSKKKIYEAWADEGSSSIVFSLIENLAEERARGLLSKAKFLHRVEADTHEEANAVHNIKMGWEPYIPMGKPAECPNPAEPCTIRREAVSALTAAGFARTRRKTQTGQYRDWWPY